MKNNNFTSGWVRPMEENLERGGGTSHFGAFPRTHIWLFFGFFSSFVDGLSWMVLGWCLDGLSWMEAACKV